MDKSKGITPEQELVVHCTRDSSDTSSVVRIQVLPVDLEDQLSRVWIQAKEV